MKLLTKIIPVFVVFFLFSCNEKTPAKLEQEAITNNDSLMILLKKEISLGNKERANEIMNFIKNSFPQTEQLTEAEKMMESLEQEVDSTTDKITDKKSAIDDAVKKQGMKMLYDSDSKSTWYVDETTPIGKDLNTFFLYIQENAKQEKTLRIRIQYASDPWLNAKQYYFKIDSLSYFLDVTRDEVTPKNIKGNLWEYYDVEANGKINEIVKKIASANVVFIKYDGINYDKERYLTLEEKAAMKNMIARFEESFFK